MLWFGRDDRNPILIPPNVPLPAQLTLPTGFTPTAPFTDHDGNEHPAGVPLSAPTTIDGGTEFPQPFLIPAEEPLPNPFEVEPLEHDTGNVTILPLPCTTVAPSATFTMLAECTPGIASLPAETQKNQPPGPSNCKHNCSFFRRITGTCCGIGGFLLNPLLIPAHIPLPWEAVFPGAFVFPFAFTIGPVSIEANVPIPEAILVPTGFEFPDALHIPPLLALPDDSVEDPDPGAPPASGPGSNPPGGPLSGVDDCDTPQEVEICTEFVHIFTTTTDCFTVTQCEDDSHTITTTISGTPKESTITFTAVDTTRASAAPGVLLSTASAIVSLENARDATRFSSFSGSSSSSASVTSSSAGSSSSPPPPPPPPGSRFPHCWYNSARFFTNNLDKYGAYGFLGDGSDGEGLVVDLMFPNYVNASTPEFYLLEKGIIDDNNKEGPLCGVTSPSDFRLTFFSTFATNGPGSFGFRDSSGTQGTCTLNNSPSSCQDSVGRQWQVTDLMICVATCNPSYCADH
ncbi:hypothetical protein F5884DRAFT_895838 [Xylogone sp. PMI_703]|nr:hypothetical protein F5884DRAFT_895838 [Xylogone sp. PMI_703]